MADAVTKQRTSAGSPVQWLKHPDNNAIAAVSYEGSEPTILFCGGFNSDMTGQKATYLQEACRKAGRGFVRFDYRGHGISDGEVWQYTITDWIEDTLLVVRQLVPGKIVVVGSSMGGWIMCQLIKRLPSRIAGCVGIAVAPDFTEEMQASLTDEQRAALEQGEIAYVPSEYDSSGYAITRELLEEGKRQRVLDGEIPVNFPVRLFHGTLDNAVPWRQSVKLMELLQGEDIRLTLVKGGDHRLSEPGMLSMLAEATLAME